VEGRIATVTGVPGRSGEWNAAKTSGMALRADENGNEDRDDDFAYPDAAEGLSVAVKEDVAACEDIRQRLRGEVEGAPGCTDPQGCADACTWANEQRYPVTITVRRCTHVRCADQCQIECHDETNPDDPDGPRIEVCNRFCEETCEDEPYDATDEAYFDARGAADQFDCSRCIEGDEEIPEEAREENAGEKYVCTGDANEAANGTLTVRYGWVWGDADGSAILPTLPQCRRFWLDEPTEFPNCVTCGKEDAIAVPGETESSVKNPQTPGLECRCGTGDDGAQTGCRATTRTSPSNGAVYQSFFRTYPGRYERAQAVGVGEEVLAGEAEVACYGFYDEFDPRSRQTQEADRRCVINIDVSQMPLQQRGHGSFGAPDPSTGPLPDDPAIARPPDASFNQQSDLWFPGLGGAFSLTSQPVFDGSLARALLTLDDARLTAARQTANALWAEKTPRAFDDTGEARTVARWWEEQQTRARSLFRAPSVRLLLPSPESYGAPVTQTADDDRAPQERRSAPITVQVDADDNLLAIALDALQQGGRLQLRTVHVPIDVPMASSVELRDLAHRWCLQWMLTASVQDCSGAPAPVQALMESFNAYAQHIDDVRMVRAALPETVGKALRARADALAPVRAWLEENVVALRAVQEEQRTLAELLPAWQEVERSMVRFHDDVNMPWCMNRRFTTPVFSLLDPWLPGRVDDGSVLANTSAAGLPSLPDIARVDAMLDLSALHVDGGALVLPVFDVKQISFDLHDYQPPEERVDGATVPKPLEPLRDLQPALDAMREAANGITAPPVIVLNPPPVLSLPPSLSENERTAVQQSTEAIGTVIAEMAKAYGDFWASMGPLKPDRSDAGEISEQKEAQRCVRFGEGACMHVETDLHERFTTIGSRLGVLVDDDLAPSVFPRASPSVCADGHVCTLLPPVRIAAPTGWQAIGTGNMEVDDDSVETLRAAARAVTLPSPLGALPVGSVPRFAAPLNDIIRSLFIPPVIDLAPPSS
jgi:hypothetical protein